MNSNAQMRERMHVMVIGGGLGGLCLAHGLKKAGVHVTVYEREPAADLASEGYSIEINADGNAALHTCLPSDLWRTYVAIAAQPATGIRFTTHQLKRLMTTDWPQASDPIQANWRVSRPKLRQVLLSGLDDEVEFGKKFLRYERTSHDHVQAFFEDGTSAAGDVLVGADGVGSNVRRQLLPHARVHDLHIAAVGARYRLTPDTATRLPRLQTNQITIVLPPRDCGMLITPFARPTRQDTSGLGAEYAELLAPDLEDHIFWALLARQETFGVSRELKQLSATELQDVALRMIHDWDPELRRLVTESELQTLTTISLYSADPVPTWETTNITVLGDAIHVMTPLQGLGGNTALRDASVLCGALARVDRDQDLVSALRQYEAEMRKYGSEAVRASLQYTRSFVSHNRVARAGFESTLRVADRIPPLKQRMFGLARSVR